jgi:hypothetical protein
MSATELTMNRERVRSFEDLFHAVVFCLRTSRKLVWASDEVEHP